ESQQSNRYPDARAGRGHPRLYDSLTKKAARGAFINLKYRLISDLLTTTPCGGDRSYASLKRSSSITFLCCGGAASARVLSPNSLDLTGLIARFHTTKIACVF